MPIKTTKRRRNTDSDAASAARLSAKFHGRPPRKITEYSEAVLEHSELADLGRMVELQVMDSDRYITPLEFAGNIRLASTPDGGQLYFVGGNQEVPLRKLQLAANLPKDHVTIGQVLKIAYHTSKAFHSFEPSVYEHEFGEDGGSLPWLQYDVLNKKLYLTGGSYRVKKEGIVN